MSSSASDPELELPWIETPLIESRALSKAAGCRIFLKLENLQPSGSFKSRGIGNILLQAVKAQRATGDSRELHFYISSGGNAGLACVAAARSLGCKSTVVIPESTETSMVARLRTAGATDVIVYGANFAAANSYLRDVLMPEAEKHGGKPIYVHPFDHQDVWTGASTMITEIKKQLPTGAPDAVVCSVGGGGLFSGLMEGITRESWATQMIAVETLGADSLAQSIQKKELVTLPAITSIATSLGASIVARRALDYGLQSNVTSVVIEDAEACAGMWRFADDERFLVEPACGAAVALAYDGRLKKYLKGFSEDSVVVLVVCGGSRIDLERMDMYKQQFGARVEELGMTMNVDVPSTHTVPS